MVSSKQETGRVIRMILSLVTDIPSRAENTEGAAPGQKAYIGFSAEISGTGSPAGTGNPGHLHAAIRQVFAAAPARGSRPYIVHEDLKGTEQNRDQAVC